MGNKTPNSKNKKRKLLFETNPIENADLSNDMGRPNKKELTNIKELEKSRFNSEFQQKQSNKLSTFRESFKRNKKKPKSYDIALQEMSESVDFIKEFCNIQELHNVKLDFQCPSLITYNFENLPVFGDQKQIKLISFEEILSSASLKQNNQKDDRKLIIDQIKKEIDGTRLVFFDFSKQSLEPIHKKITKFNKYYVPSTKNLEFMNLDHNKSNSSFCSEKMSEKMVENLAQNKHEINESKRSEQSLLKKTLKENEKNSKIITPSIDSQKLFDNIEKSDAPPQQITNNIVLSLTKFKKNTNNSQKDIVENKVNSHENSLNFSENFPKSDAKRNEKEISKETSKFNITSINEGKSIQSELKRPFFDSHTTSKKNSRHNSKDSLKNDNNDSKLKHSHQNSLKESEKGDKTENKKVSKFFKEVIKEEINQAIDHVNTSLRNSQRNSFHQSKILQNIEDSPENSKILQNSINWKFDFESKQKLKESQSKVYEMILNERLMKKQREEEYVLSPNRIIRHYSHSPTPKSKQLFIRNHYLNTHENTYFQIMNNMKKHSDLSYNKLFDTSDILKDANANTKILNKTTEITQINKSISILKNSKNLQNRSYLSTPMILIDKKAKEKKNPASNNLKIDTKKERKSQTKQKPQENNIAESPNSPKKIRFSKKLSLKRTTKQINETPKNEENPPTNFEKSSLKINQNNPKNSVKEAPITERPSLTTKRESKKSVRLSNVRNYEGGAEDPTPKMSIRTRASYSSENNPEKMIRNVRIDIEQLKNKIKGRLAADIFGKINVYHH